MSASEAVPVEMPSEPDELKLSLDEKIVHVARVIRRDGAIERLDVSHCPNFPGWKNARATTEMDPILCLWCAVLQNS